VHPPANLPAGAYAGAMAVVAVRSPGDSKGNGQVWTPGQAQFPRLDTPTASNNLVSTKLCWQDQDLITPTF
jgi:hypothetical protein